MTASRIGYEKVIAWVNCYLVGVHKTTVKTISWVVVCLLVSQRLTPAALARAIPMEESGTGRNRLRRVQRWRQGPPLDSGRLCPWLVKATLALLLPAQPVVVAMDTTRVGKWELFVAGIVFGSRVMPIAWAVIPYPWPKGMFRQTTLRLVEEMQAGFGSEHVWELVADRIFPNSQLFSKLQANATGFTIRLRLSSWVEIEGVYAQVKDHLEAGRIKPGQRVAATIGSGRNNQPQTSAWVVVSQDVTAPPKHKQNPGSTDERDKRHKQRIRHLNNKGPKSKPPSAIAQKYAQTWVLFTTADSVEQAVSHYGMRMAIEETFRDWHHHLFSAPSLRGLVW